MRLSNTKRFLKKVTYFYLKIIFLKKKITIFLLKFVKSYVKKFYFRISKFPDDNNLYKNKTFLDYLKITDFMENDDYVNVSRKFNDKFAEILNPIK